MSQPLTFTAEIVEEEGIHRLKMTSPAYFQTRIQKSQLGKYSVTVSDKKLSRSIQQNNFYWLYLGLISEETGNSPQDLHEYFRSTHLPHRYITVMKKNITVIGSTTKLNKSEFSEYIKNIEVETGVLAPNPCEAGFFCGKSSCEICNKDIKEMESTIVEYPESTGDIKF